MWIGATTRPIAIPALQCVCRVPILTLGLMPHGRQVDRTLVLCRWEIYLPARPLWTKSTLPRKLNDSDYAGAADQFQVWNRGGSPSQVMPGLTDRRAGEADIFRNGVYTNHN